MTNITIYSTPTCPYCTMAKDFLTENKIKFTNIDVSANHEKAHEMIEKTGQMGVPVITVKQNNKEEIMVGFDQQALSKILGIR